MEERTCSLEGCERPHHAKGMCKSCYRKDHYQRNRDDALQYAKDYWAENREAIVEREKARFRANPESRRAVARRYKAANPDKTKATAERFRRKHPERQAAWGAAWYQQNREYARQLQAAWRASKMQDPEWLKRERMRSREKQSRRRELIRESGEEFDLFEILERDGMMCHICGGEIPSLDDLHFDHVIPLARGGAHSTENIKPSHAKCNLRKGARLLEELN